MIAQSGSVVLRQRNQPSRECLYAWYPEVASDISSSTPVAPRDIYIHRGLDKDLLNQSLPINTLSNSSNKNVNYEIVQRYGESMAPSEPIYHSIETINDALRTPWAQHYEIQRRPATPNPPSHSTEKQTHEETPRRLKSAPVGRSLPPTSILTIPEPRHITPIIPVTSDQVIRPTSSTKPRSRASSARARLNTTFPTVNELQDDELRQTQQSRRDIKSALAIRPKSELKVLNESNEKGSTQAYIDIVQQRNDESSSLCSSPKSTNTQLKASNELPSTPTDKITLRAKVEANPIPLNPYYVHRPGVIAVNNCDKKPLVRDGSASKKVNRHHRRHHNSRHHHHHHNTYGREKRHEPLLALTPITQSNKTPVEIDGIKLIYDPTLTLDDASLNLTKYFVDGHLYLIKDQHYNVLDNVDPATIEKYNQSSSLPQRPKYYQTIQVEKFQIPKPAPEIHYNASETYFYNTLPNRVPRYVIDPNFISENLNVSKISISKRPLTPTVVHAKISDINRQQVAPTTVYS